MVALTLTDTIEKAGVRDGATLSFHHHLRNGDDVMRKVLAACDTLGLRDLHIAPSSLFPCHASLIPYLQNGTVTRITTSYMTGPLADAVRAGALPHPVVLQTHGGRAHAIASDQLKIDAAFIAAPAVGIAGNLSGATGPEACGPLGYAMVDAAHARQVIAVTDHVAKHLPRICIPADQVDHIVHVPRIGEASRIVSGTTGRAPSNTGLIIADFTARLIATSGLMQNGFTFQTGAGATSLAVARALAPLMAARNVKGDFAAGGITGALVEMLQAGLFARLWDVQAFDLAAVQSYAQDTDHLAMSADLYANPTRLDSIAKQLDVMILGAAEIDMDFNVNVTCASDGRIIGGSGGHADTAAGAKLPIVTTSLVAGGYAKLVKHLTCLTTPGATIGALVTEAGIAIHPSRPDLATSARQAGLPIMDINDLRRLAQEQANRRQSPRRSGRIIASCQAPNGTVIDHIRA